MGTRVLERAYGKLKSGSEVTLLELLTESSRLNDVSIERTFLSNLVGNGYTIDELEVEFVGMIRTTGCGRCIWYKEHDSYTNPTESRRALMPHATAKTLSFVCAMFKTEHCGDQEFTLLSTQMASAFIFKSTLKEEDPAYRHPVPFLFHKTIVFRRVVLSKRKPAAFDQ